METLKLYHAMIEVEPLPGHPLYWQISHGLFHVFICDCASQEAGQRAFDLAKLLNLQPAQGALSVFECTEAITSEVNPQWVLEAVLRARILGVGLFLEFDPVGSDPRPGVKFQAV